MMIMKKIMQNVFLLILFSSSTLYSIGQEKSNDQLKSLISQIAKSNVYEMSDQIGVAGSPSKQLERFSKLISLSTEQQLVELASKNTNAVVRLYAFQALKQKNIVIPTALQKQFQNDQTIVTTLTGCIGREATVQALSKQILKPAIVTEEKS